MRLGRELRDPNEEALLDPLEHEPVVREQSVAPGGAFERKRPDPGVELLGRQLLAEGIEAALPEKGTAGHACSIRGDVAADRRAATVVLGIVVQRQEVIHRCVVRWRDPPTRLDDRSATYRAWGRAQDAAGGNPTGGDRINAAAIDSDGDNAL